MLLEKGKIYGLVGMNGSGKTVLMKCICGFLQSTKGKVTVEGKVIGKDVDFPENLGVMIEKPGFIPYMSGKSNLQNFGSDKTGSEPSGDEKGEGRQNSRREREGRRCG